MTVDNQTTIVYFSDLLPGRCPMLYQSIIDTFEGNGIRYELLQGTKDFWCRDYMPIQIDKGCFVYYKYNPDYLQTPYYRRTITDVDQINVPGSVGARLNLVIDGGNVVKCGDKVVMTEKVFVENKEISRTEVTKILEDAFCCKVVFLPWDRHEIMGHSDGIVHYAGSDRVLMTNYDDFDKGMSCRFRRILDKYFDVVSLHYNVKCKHKHSWAYINFLQVGNLVLVPQLGIPEDDQAVTQIASTMSSCKIVGVPALEAVRRGGALNCISWNICI